MKLNVFVVFFAPTVLATTKVWNLSGSCNAANVCDVDTAFNDPNNPKVCNGRAGQYVDTGINGRTWCSPPGTKCTYVWRC
ncbi:hypothetical protein AA0112_g12457 [Alternaria arborescens]|nr:hypothetical protein AA0112_g12457 [Alternaria arborescens]